MQRFLAVFNSDQINLYEMRFSVKALESCLSQSWDFGVPSLRSHDFHRPIAWSRGLSLHIEPSLTRLTGLCFIPENDEESEEISKRLRIYLSKRIAEVLDPHMSELAKRVTPHFSGINMPYMPNCAAIVEEGLARKVFPKIFSQEDKDGLVPLSLLTPKAPGVFEKEGLLLFAHPYFRRSLSRLNSMNTPFFQVLQNLIAHPDLEILIALDEDMVGLSNTYARYVELEYWWGPKFSEDLTAIPLGVVTRHEANEQQKPFHGISATEFWWYLQNGKHTLECEELKDIPSLGVSNDKFGCRYVHCMVDPSSSVPVHLDGAIRMYNEDSMISRLDTDIRRSGRHSDYKKLWRIDGPLQVPIWKELITHYYRDNHLVGEYLGGKDESGHIRPHSVSSSTYEIPLAQYIPCNMEEGQGIRISVSYHPKSEEQFAGRLIRTFDSLTCGSETYEYIEADTIEVVKALHRMDETIELPDNIVRITFTDMVLNLPLILHLGPDSVSLALNTQRAIAQLCEGRVNSENNVVISYNIGIQYSDRDVYFSIAGHVEDLKAWHQSPQSRFPRDSSELGDWCNKASKLLSETFPKGNNNPPLHDMLQQSGILIFERRFLTPEEYRMHFDDNQKALVVQLAIPKDDQNLYEIVASGRLGVGCAFLVRDSKCSRCRNSYHMCNCSKYLDNDVTQIMTDASFLRPFWTNRNA